MNQEFYPGSILTILGYQCTNKCKYCYLRVNGAKMDDNMSLETFENTIKWYQEYLNSSSAPWLPSIALIGGEPLCYWEALNFDKNLPILGETIRKYGKEVRIVSNGILLDDRKIQFLADHGIQIDISLDGDKITHDANRLKKDDSPTFDIVYENIQKILKTTIDMRIRGTITKNTAHRAFECYKFLSNLGCPRLGMEIDTFTIWSTQELGTLAVQYEKILEDYIDNYTPERHFFSFDRVLKTMAPSFITSQEADVKFLRPNSIAVLPGGEIKVNHNFPVWADKKTAELFNIGQIDTGFDEQVVAEYLKHFGLMTESAYYATNDKMVCESCPGNHLCQNPYNNTTLPRTVWKDEHLVQCYALRLIAFYGAKHLRRRGLYEI